MFSCVGLSIIYYYYYFDDVIVWCYYCNGYVIYCDCCVLFSFGSKFYHFIKSCVMLNYCCYCHDDELFFNSAIFILFVFYYFRET